MRILRTMVASLLVSIIVLSNSSFIFANIPTINTIIVTHPDYLPYEMTINEQAQEFNTFDIVMKYPDLTIESNYPDYTYTVLENGKVAYQGTSTEEVKRLNIPTRDYTVRIDKEGYTPTIQNVSLYTSKEIDLTLKDTVTFLINKGAGSYTLRNTVTDWTTTGDSSTGILSKIEVPEKGNYELTYVPNSHYSTQTYPFYVEGDYYSYLDTANGYDALVGDLELPENDPTEVEQGAFQRYITLETQYAGKSLDNIPDSAYTFDYTLTGINNNFYKEGTNTTPSLDIRVPQTGDYVLTIEKEGYAFLEGDTYTTSRAIKVDPSEDEITYTVVDASIYKVVNRPEPIPETEGTFKRTVEIRTQYAYNPESALSDDVYKYNYTLVELEDYYANPLDNPYKIEGTAEGLVETIDINSSGDYRLYVDKEDYTLSGKDEEGNIWYSDYLDFQTTTGSAIELVTEVDIFLQPVTQPPIVTPTERPEAFDLTDIHFYANAANFSLEVTGEENSIVREGSSEDGHIVLQVYENTPYTVKASAENYNNFEATNVLFVEGENFPVFLQPIATPPIILPPERPEAFNENVVLLRSNLGDKGYKFHMETVNGSYPYSVKSIVGDFRIELPAAGEYKIQADRFGYYSIDTTVNINRGSQKLTLTFQPKEWEDLKDDIISLIEGGELDIEDLPDLIKDLVEEGLLDKDDLPDLIGDLVDKDLIDVIDIPDLILDLIDEDVIDWEDVPNIITDLMDDGIISTGEAEDILDSLKDNGLEDETIINSITDTIDSYKPPISRPSGGGGSGSGNKPKPPESTIALEPEENIPLGTAEDEITELIVDLLDEVDRMVMDGTVSPTDYVEMVTDILSLRFKYHHAEVLIDSTEFYEEFEDSFKIRHLEVPATVYPYDNRTRVAVTDFFDLSDTEITWDEITGEVHVIFSNRLTMTFEHDSNIVSINGVEVAMQNADGTPVNIVIIEGKTTIPLRFVAEAFGFDVGWNQEYQRVTLDKELHSNLINSFEDLLNKE